MEVLGIQIHPLKAVVGQPSSRAIPQVSVSLDGWESNSPTLKDIGAPIQRQGMPTTLPGTKQDPDSPQRQSDNVT